MGRLGELLSRRDVWEYFDEEKRRLDILDEQVRLKYASKVDLQLAQLDQKLDRLTNSVFLAMSSVSPELQGLRSSMYSLPSSSLQFNHGQHALLDYNNTHKWVPPPVTGPQVQRPMPLSLNFDPASAHDLTVSAGRQNKVLGNGSSSRNAQIKMEYETKLNSPQTRPVLTSVGSVVQLFLFGVDGHFPLLFLKKKNLGTQFLLVLTHIYYLTLCITHKHIHHV